MKESLIAVERLLWHSGAEVHRRYVLEDAVIVFDAQEAVSRDVAIALIERMDVLGERWADVSFHDTQCVELDGDTGIISYRASGHVRGRKTGLSARCTSLYMRRNGQFQLAFHEHLGPMV